MIDIHDFNISATNAIDDPFFIKDSSHRWRFLNKAALTLMNGSADELIGKSDFDLFDGNQARVFCERDTFVIETGSRDINEEVITWREKLHYISTKKNRYIDPETKEVYVVGTIRDITKRRTIEELQISPGLASFLKYDNLSIGVTVFKPILYGTQFKILYSNKEAELHMPDLPGTISSKSGHFELIHTVSSSGISSTHSSPGLNHEILFFRAGSDRICAVSYKLDDSILSENPPLLRSETSSPNSSSITASRISDEIQLNNLKRIICDRKLFRDENLNLQTLSLSTGMNRNRLSSLIQRATDGNFYDFINGFRIEEVKQQLYFQHRSEEYSRTILDIALSAGFNAKSTFNKAFKKQTGMTPSEYCKNWSV